jgi:hypothetical protein
MKTFPPAISCLDPSIPVLHFNNPLTQSDSISLQKAMSESDIQKGTVKWFKQEKGFGMLTPPNDDFEEELFFLLELDEVRSPDTFFSGHAHRSGNRANKMDAILARPGVA